MSDKDQQLADQFLDAWRQAKDDETRKQILQKVIHSTPAPLIPHFMDWLDDAPPSDMFRVVERYKLMQNNPFIRQIIQDDTHRPKLVGWLEKLIQTKDGFGDFEKAVADLLLYVAKQPQEFDFILSYARHISENLQLTQKARDQADMILAQLANYTGRLSPEQLAIVNADRAKKTLIRLKSQWASAHQNPTAQETILAQIYVYKTQGLLPTLLEWFATLVVPDKMVLALDVYLNDIIGNDNYRNHIINYLTQAIHALSQSAPKPNAHAVYQRPIANFIEEIATTPQELMPVIAYHQEVLRTSLPSDYLYTQSVNHLRSLTIRKDPLITADVFTNLLLFLEKIPTKPLYDIRYHLNHAASPHWGRTFVEGRNAQQAEDGLKQQLSYYNDGVGSYRSEVLWMVKIS